jgi:hypothetical protein
MPIPIRHEDGEDWQVVHGSKYANEVPGLVIPNSFCLRIRRARVASRGKHPPARTVERMVDTNAILRGLNEIADQYDKGSIRILVNSYATKCVATDLQMAIMDFTAEARDHEN